MGARITVFTVFFGQNQAKTLVFMQFQHVARNKFSMQKNTKHCKLNYSALGLFLGFVGGWEAGGPKMNEQQPPE